MAKKRDIPEKFLVAFSLAGEERAFVKSVAEAVEEKLGTGTVFYDEWYEYYIAGEGADLKLQKIYGERSLLVVVCVSERYGNKPWTKMEHSAIRALSMKLSVSPDEKQRDRILPLRVADGEVEGINFNAICKDIRDKEPTQAAEFIIDRLGYIDPNYKKQIEMNKAKDAAHSVYLAQCPPDNELMRQHRQMKAFLQGLGWRVLPETYPEQSTPDEYKNRMEEDLQSADAFVQLLGFFPWQPGNYDRIQHEAAVARPVPRFRFCSPLGEQDEIDTARKGFISADETMIGGFEDFKKELEKKLNLLRFKLENPDTRAEDEAIPPKILVVVRSPNREPLWDTAYRWVNENEKLHSHELDTKEKLEVKYEQEPCHGFLIMCDSAALEEGGAYSPRDDLETCRNIQLRWKDDKERRPPVGLVYCPPPQEVKWSNLVRSTPLNLYEILGDTQANLKEFFAAVRKVKVGP